MDDVLEKLLWVCITCEAVLDTLVGPREPDFRSEENTGLEMQFIYKC